MIVLRKELFGLTATDEESEAFMRGVKLGQCIEVKPRKPRNIGHHRKFFGLLNLVFENQEIYPSLDVLLDAVKIGIGHAYSVQVGKQTYLVPKSIDFASLDQVAFEGFYNRAVDWLLAEVVPGTNRADLEREVLERAR